MAVNPKVLTSSGFGLGALGFSSDLSVALGTIFRTATTDELDAWGRLVQGVFVVVATYAAGYYTPDTNTSLVESNRALRAEAEKAKLQLAINGRQVQVEQEVAEALQPQPEGA